MDLSGQVEGLSAAELTRRYGEPGARLPEGLLERLAADPRAAVKALAARIERRRKAEQAETARLARLVTYEKEAWALGHVHVAGSDEVGVGPLAGPVVAGACILPRDWRPRGLDDSKKLTHAEHVRLSAELKANAIAWALGRAEPAEIDRVNIHQAGLLAMRRAVEGLGVKPDFLLVDARTIPGVRIPQRSLIQGDAKSLSIAAASVLAKAARDAEMVEMDARWPGYGFADHKGYPAPLHLERLRALGPCPIHRRSYAPVQVALGLHPQQSALFASEVRR